ncbi:nucleoside diphosphate kinase, partial [Daedalea quercina L-15889]
PTRTVAIIKPHALPHRFDIEHRISEAGFEIVKERQMEFDVETDPETLYELFGDDCECFAEGPVWVYVLERRRAVEMWATLMGHPDPAIARLETPTALRALYGASPQQNAVMGSPDVTTAEMQISSIFASSPPFPTTDLPDVGSGLTTTSSLRSASSSLLSALRKTGSSDSASGKTPFKARRLPATHAAPDIVPRMSRAAALRVGIPVEKTGGPRGPLSKERLAQTFENVPGHKRTSTITVASTAPPTVAPRMTRAAALRLGLPPPEKENRRASMQVTTKTKSPDEASKATFDGVPGHKRRETITVASVKTPTVMPRTNRSAALRQQKETAPPTSYMCKCLLLRPSGRSIASTSSVSSNGDHKDASAKAKPRPRPSSMQAPTIAPRTNKSALLRAQKMAA